MLANIEAESTFDPTIAELNPQSGQGGIGLFQHTGPRRDALLNYVKNDLTNWKAQIDFALQEADTSSYLNSNFNSPEEASEWFTINWERPRDLNQEAKKRRTNVSKYNF